MRTSCMHVCWNSEQVLARPGWVRARHARRVCDAHSSSSRESCAHRMPTALRSGVAPAQTIGVALAVDSHVSFTHAALQCRHRPPGCCDGRRALYARFWQQSALCTTASAKFQCRPRARCMASTRRDVGHCRCMAQRFVCMPSVELLSMVCAPSPRSPLLLAPVAEGGSDSVIVH